MNQGGALRCYDAETEEGEEEREKSEEGEGKERGYTDVAPLGGRLILFSSRHILHEVRVFFEITKMRCFVVPFLKACATCI
jgi:hypothetical protein